MSDASESRDDLRSRLRQAPAAERNRAPLWTVLAPRLPATGDVLEIASGTGEHAAWFAAERPGLVWQPSDGDPDALDAIAARVTLAALDNPRPPLRLDVHDRPWRVAPVDAVLCVNLLHVAPWSAAEALLAGAAEVLRAGSGLFVYGPFKKAGKHTAESNARFDEVLRARDPSYGIRDLDDIAALARSSGLRHAETVDMPANNLTLVFERPPGPDLERDPIR